MKMHKKENRKYNKILTYVSNTKKLNLKRRL